jgi:hypothetical protein
MAGEPAVGLQIVTRGIQYGTVGGSRSPEGRWWRGIWLAYGVWKTPIPFGQSDPPCKQAMSWKDRWEKTVLCGSGSTLASNNYLV